jgi:hypothetical protein
VDLHLAAEDLGLDGHGALVDGQLHGGVAVVVEDLGARAVWVGVVGWLGDGD